MKLLVTGGAGRIGRYVVDELAPKHEVTVFSRQAEPRAEVLTVQGDVREREVLWRALAGQDAVLHLASVPMFTDDNTVFFDLNLAGTFNLLEGAARADIKKVVFASSICSYGFINWKQRWTPDYFPVDEEHPARPDDMYGVSKLAGDELCYAYSQRYRISTICLRIGSVWFPGLEWTKRFIDRLDKPEQAVNHIWNYVDVRDVARAFALALDKEVQYAVYNIGARDVASRLESLDLIRRFYPDVALIRNHHQFLLEPQRALYDISKARRELGYEPAHTWREYV